MSLVLAARFNQFLSSKTESSCNRFFRYQNYCITFTLKFQSYFFQSLARIVSDCDFSFEESKNHSLNELLDTLFFGIFGHSAYLRNNLKVV